MAVPAGETVGRYNRSPESSGIFPTYTFDFGRLTSDGLQMDANKVMPRWGGHGLSWPPDSGIYLDLPEWDWRIRWRSGGFPFRIHVQLSQEDNNSTPALEPGQIYVDESAYVCGHD